MAIFLDQQHFNSELYGNSPCPEDDIDLALREYLRAIGAGNISEMINHLDLKREIYVNGNRYLVHIIQLQPHYSHKHRELSPREQEIARLITKGLPNKQIAAELELRPCTVGTYTKRIFLKLDVSSRAEMVAKVISGHLLHGMK